MENEFDENLNNKDSNIIYVEDKSKVYEEDNRIYEQNNKVSDDKSLYESFQTVNKLTDSCSFNLNNRSR